MSIFFDVKHTSININKIKEIGIARKDAIRITFDDDSSDVYSTFGDAVDTMERFGKTIVQITPCPHPLYNVYTNDDGSYFHERVFCLALCADGTVRSLAGCEYFDLAEEAQNFVGCYDEEGLENYPGA